MIIKRGESVGISSEMLSKLYGGEGGGCGGCGKGQVWGGGGGKLVIGFTKRPFPSSPSPENEVSFRKDDLQLLRS